MSSRLRACALLAGFALLSTAVFSGDRDDRFHQEDRHDGDRFSFAVIGDWPYSQALLDNAHLLVNSINDDRDVDLVIHVGDIHSGSMPCTSAYTLPPIAASNPGWNQSVFNVFQRFEAPLVYTPGDNEWADCHKGKQFSSGHPLRELASVRELFFSRPGVTLGMHPSRVRSQAEHFDPAFPADAQFVENVMWEQDDVLFVTLNVPGGSNDDTAPWTGIFAKSTDQAQEVQVREAANLRWLQDAFRMAQRERARAVVVILQADLWDPEAVAPGGAGLNKYTPLVQLLATSSLQFRRPVLLLNGDTHLYLGDRPLADPNSITGKIHNTPAVPNLQRLVVQGSTNAPAEWLKVTVDPRNPAVFSWSNVAYCAVPTSVTCN
jgi:hypothetical protein